MIHRVTQFCFPFPFIQRWTKLVHAKHREIDEIIRERAQTVPSHANIPVPRSNLGEYYYDEDEEQAQKLNQL